MSNWWNTSDGEDLTQSASKEFDAGGGNFEPIPDGTKVLAYIDGANWDNDREGSEHVKVTWTILKPEGYQNRKVFQKIWVSDDKPKTKDAEADRNKAKKMLAAIDANAKGKLMKGNGKPDDDDLAIALSNAQMVIRLGLWEMDGKSGNWVSAIMPKTSEISEGPAKKAKEKLPIDDDLDSDIPF